MKRALLLSGSLGAGHDMHAEVCASSLTAAGWSCEVLDTMRLLGRRGGPAGESAFRAMLAVPGAYDAFHFAALRPGGRLALLADAAARRQVVPRLRAHLDSAPAELVISVFATGAAATSVLAGRYPATRHVVLCSDVTPHRLWVHPGVDMYLVTSRAAEAAVRRYAPDARVRVIPSPVRSGFRRPPTRQEARATLALGPAEHVVLLMSGAWGLGPVAGTATALADAGVRVLAVAGRNARLEARLRAAARGRSRLRVFGYSREIPTLMAAADLVITSSGDTCAEARAVGRPLLVLDVVPGHGRDNLQHELELGAAVTSPRPPDVLRCALAALDRASPAASGAAPATPGETVAGEWEAAFAAALADLGFGQELALSRAPR